MSVFQNGFLRTAPNGPLLVIDKATAVAQTAIHNGHLRDGNYYLVTTVTGPGVWHDGFQVDANYNLLCTDESTATGVAMHNGLLRDANGYLVTTTNAQTQFARGFALDAAGNVCVSGTI
jgi:hypothetical protein